MTTIAETFIEQFVSEGRHSFRRSFHMRFGPLKKRIWKLKKRIRRFKKYVWKWFKSFKERIKRLRPQNGRAYFLQSSWG